MCKDDRSESATKIQMFCLECDAHAVSHPMKSIQVRDTRYSSDGDPSETDFDAELMANGWVSADGGEMCENCHNIPQRTVMKVREVVYA